MLLPLTAALDAPARAPRQTPRQTPRRETPGREPPTTEPPTTEAPAREVPGREVPGLGVGAIAEPGPGGRRDEVQDAGLAAQLAEARSAIDVLAAQVTDQVRCGDLDGRDAATALLAIDVLAGRLNAMTARLMPTVEADGWWAIDGFRSSAAWLTTTARMPYTRARALVATGRAMRDALPASAQAAIEGTVPFDHVQTLTRLAATTPTRRTALDDEVSGCGEQFLLTHARILTADTFTALTRRWAAAADPDADERGHTHASDREHLQLSGTTHGFHLTGFLTTEHGATLHTALNTLMSPPTPDDTRTTTQRRARALTDLARLTLDHNLTTPGPSATGTSTGASTGAAAETGTGSAKTATATRKGNRTGTGTETGTGTGGPGSRRGTRPHITCVVDYTTLLRALGHPAPPTEPTKTGGPAGTTRPAEATETAGDPARAGGPAGFRLPPVSDIERFAVAEILGAGPIPPSVLARLACDSQINRLIFGPHSQVINAGRTERTYTGPRRHAILARDQTCRYPHCTAPPALTEIHHTHHWTRDHGTTNTNTGILLCYHHHQTIHTHHIEITPTPTGGWTFTHPNGTPIRGDG